MALNCHVWNNNNVTYLHSAKCQRPLISRKMFGKFTLIEGIDYCCLLNVNVIFFQRFAITDLRLGHIILTSEADQVFCVWGVALLPIMGDKVMLQHQHAVIWVDGNLENRGLCDMGFIIT